LTAASLAGLVTACAISFWFPSTRGIGILATALLSIAYPWLSALILLASAASFFLFHVRK
jgi:hypothetical protein